MNGKHLLLVTLFIAAMLLAGLLRLSGGGESPLAPFSGYATPLYVGATLAFIFLFMRAGIELNHVGFDPGFKWSFIALAAGGVLVLQLSGWLIDPLLERHIGGGRDLSRFSEVEGSIEGLLIALALSWTFAAFGEEIAYRIVMLRGLVSALGQGRAAIVAAVVIQAVVFGLVHLYQGPAGAVGATISGLVFGIVTVAGRGSIWPAALAHGANNTIGLIALYRA